MISKNFSYKNDAGITITCGFAAAALSAVGSGNWSTWLKWTASRHVAAFTQTPLVWNGEYDDWPYVLPLGITIKTNGYTCKGVIFVNGSSASTGIACTHILDGVRKCGTEPKNGAWFNGSGPGADPADMSGHLYVLAGMMAVGNNWVDAFPEYFDLLKIPYWTAWAGRAMAKTNWWALIRRVPPGLTNPAQGIHSFRGDFAYRTQVASGTRVTQGSLPAGSKTTMYVDTLAFEAGIHCADWAGQYPEIGVTGTFTLDFLGIGATCSMRIAFWGTGGFSVGGKSVGTFSAGLHEVDLTGVNSSSLPLTITAGSNVVFWVEAW